jgi:flagellar motor protein MotB
MLSAARAAAVVKELTGSYDIAAGRLSAYGAGRWRPSPPIGPRVARRNRRVDLVEQ